MSRQPFIDDSTRYSPRFMPWRADTSLVRGRALRISLAVFDPASDGNTVKPEVQANVPVVTETTMGRRFAGSVDYI